MNLLCSRIRVALDDLPKQDQADFKRIYAKTWSIVSLQGEGFVEPTKEAEARLLDLHFAIKKHVRDGLVKENA